MFIQNSGLSDNHEERKEHLNRFENCQEDLIDEYQIEEAAYEDEDVKSDSHLN